MAGPDDTKTKAKPEQIKADPSAAGRAPLPDGAGAPGAPLPDGAGAPGAPLPDTGTGVTVTPVPEVKPAAPVVIGAGPTPETPGGPGVGAAQVADITEATVSRPLTPSDEVDLGLRGSMSDRDRLELAEFRRREAERGLVIDARDVPGRRLARAAAPIKRDGEFYGPGTGRDYVPVDFEAYTQLVEIGAITRTPWPDLELEGL